MGKRTWIKIYCDKWIEGTIREETPEIRCVWIDLLALIGSQQHSDTGELRLTNSVGYTDDQITEILRIDKPLWTEAKQKFIATDRIEVSSKNVITIKNWGKYQSEYSRQKGYRENPQ